MSAPPGAGAGSAPPTPPARRQVPTWLVVLLTVGAMVLVGLVFVAGVVVGAVITREDGASAAPVGGAGLPVPGGATSQAPGDGSTDGSTGGTGGEAGALDGCLVGTWVTTEHSEDWTTDQGDARLDGLTRTMTFTADGTQTVVYAGDEATITAQGTPVPAVFDGEVVYRTSTAGGTMSFELVSAEGTVTIAPGGDEKVEPLEPGTGDVTYTCDATTLRQEAEGYLSVYERTG